MFHFLSIYRQKNCSKLKLPQGTSPQEIDDEFNRKWCSSLHIFGHTMELKRTVKLMYCVHLFIFILFHYISIYFLFMCLAVLILQQRKKYKIRGWWIPAVNFDAKTCVSVCILVVYDASSSSLSFSNLHLMVIIKSLLLHSLDLLGDNFVGIWNYLALDCLIDLAV